MTDGPFPPPGDPGGPLAWGPPPSGQPSPPPPPAGPPWAGQPYGGQPYPGQPYPGQPYPGQPYVGQSHGASMFIGVPPRPSSLSTAVLLMRIGGLIAALSVLAALGVRSEVEAALRESRPYASQSEIDAAVTLGIGFAVFFGLVGAGLWFWMASANNQGRSWARVVASVFFGFSVLSVISTQAQPGATVSKLVNLVQFGIGLAAIVLMYRPDASRYYALRRRR